MVTLGGMATAAILLVIVVAAIDFRYRRKPPNCSQPSLRHRTVAEHCGLVAMALYGAQTASANGGMRNL